MNDKKASTNAQIIYHCSISPKSILDIVIYIFTIGKDGQLELLITYTHDGEINHDQTSTHIKGKSRYKYDK
jgi:hypothetical protein